MNAQPGIVGPADYPIRDPRSPKQINGRCVNMVGYPNFGGFTGPGKWPAKSDFAVERPSRIGRVKDTAE